MILGLSGESQWFYALKLCIKSLTMSASRSETQLWRRNITPPQKSKLSPQRSVICICEKGRLYRLKVCFYIATCLTKSFLKIYSSCYLFKICLWNAALSTSSDGLIYKSYNFRPCYSNYFTKIVIPNHIYMLL